MALTAIVTNAGRAALVNASNTGTAPVTIAQVGLTATAVVPGVGITALPGEYKRVATISGDVVADDTIHLIVRDESADVFTVRSFALYLADGTLFAIYGQAGVILEKSAQAMMLLAIDVQFADVAAAMLTFGDANFLNPPATTERQGVIELSTLAEAQAGIDALRALTPATAKAAILGWLLAQDGAGSGLDADLLDGQDGSYYTNIVQRLGYTPVNKAGDTMTGALALPGDPASALQAAPKQYVDALVTAAALLAKIVTVDGSGSGLDADLLDGQDGSYYTNITARLGYTPWHPGNDGAGSGLDAGLLAGQLPSYYTDITARLGYTPANKAGDTFSGQISVPSVAFTGLANASIGTNATGLIINLDANDYVQHNRSLDRLYFTMNSVNQAYVGQDGYIWARAGVVVNGNPVWHTANDGAGSGLDADLLDGQDGTYYTNITARLGYSPASRAGDIFTGTVRVRLAANGYVELVPSAGGDTGQVYFSGSDGTRKGYIFAPSSGIMTYGNDSGSGHNFNGGQLRRDSNTVWDAGNDGAGSGLDADMLDGFHASDLLRIIAESKAMNGYMRLSNGLLLQWGNWTSSGTAGAAVTVTFPIAFSAEPYTLVSMPIITDSNNTSTWASNGITGTSFPARCNQATIGCRYFAIGPA